MRKAVWRITPRWEWDKTNKVVVFAVDDILDNLKNNVINYIKELLSEFGIPLEVIDGNLEYSEDLLIIKEIFSKSLKNNKIDFNEFYKQLSDHRNIGKLPYGVVVLIDKSRFEFLEERAIYGVGFDDGLVILRFTHKESVRHEFAHMLGLFHHDPPTRDCIMNWECPTSEFCVECKKEIQEIWKSGRLWPGRYNLL